MKTISFFKSLSWLVLLNLLVKPVWIFFIDRKVQLTSGNEEYGRYFSVLNLSYVLIFLADAGLTNMLNQRIANRIPVNTGRWVRIKILLLFIYFIACCFTGWLAHITQWTYLLYLALVQILASFYVFLRCFVTAHQHFNADAWFSITDKLLMTVFCGLILYSSFFGNMSLKIFLQIQTACTLLAILLVLAFFSKKHIALTGQTDASERMIRMVMPFALIVFLMSVHNRVDGFLLERLHHHGAVEAGMYAAGYRLLDATSMLGYLASTFLVPFIARHQQEKNLVNETVLNTRHALIFFGLGAVCFSVLFAPWIQQLLYRASDPYQSRLIQLCMATLPAYLLVHVYGSVLTAMNRLQLFIRLLFVSVVLNLVFNLLLIPQYGALACCIAALVSQYFCGISLCIFASRREKISFGLRSWLAYGITGLLLVVLFYFGPMVISSVWIILAIASILCLLLLTTQISFVKKYFVSFF
ncbi:MAG: lipopolysaccharide biosynthesis protein [Flavisolibacter sp.]